MKDSEKIVKKFEFDENIIQLFKFLEKESPEIKHFLIKSYIRITSFFRNDGNIL